MNTHDSIFAAIDSLNEINDSIYGSYKLEEAFSTILKKVSQYFSSSIVIIGTVNEDRQVVEIEVAQGIKETLAPIPLRQSIIGWTAFYRKPILIKNFKNESKLTPLSNDSISAITIPMILNGKAIGVMHIESTQANHYSLEDLKIATVFANEAGKVISNIWLMDQLKSKTDQLHSLINLNRNLVAKLDKNSILINLAQETRDLLKCHACALFLLSSDKNILDLHTMVDPTGILNDSSQIDLRDSAIGGALKRKKQIEIHNILYTEENEFNTIIQRDSLYSMLITPIIFQNQVVGVLNSYTQEMHRFSDDEKRIALALADLGAMTLENARLYEKTFTSEEILRKNEKLTTLGLLSAEIAHEIRNPLTVIKLLFQTLDLQFDPTDPRSKDAELIAERIDHLETIVERVLGFSHRNHNTKSQNCLSTLVEESLQLVRLKLNQLKIKVSFEKPDSELPIEVNKGQIQQVILNLIFNASQAISKAGGSIHIKAFQDEQFAYFNIQDNGHGIPESIKDRIFESFLTNRSEGTGLGLSIAKGILASHRGSISLIKSDPEGTIFEFALPLSSI
ncbi:MAG: GAF domain-containing protein [Coraliomargaritaceae bacterium]